MPRFRPLLPVALAILLVFAQVSTAQPIDRQRLLDRLAFLASSEMAGRYPGTEGHARAHAFLERTFDELNLRLAYPARTDTFAFTNRRNGNRYVGQNIAGWVQGTRHPESFLIVMAHYDHLGVRDGQTYFGADDNASGVVALLELAERVSQSPLEHSVLFLALDAEEMGLQGARHVVENPPVPLTQVRMVINMDMVSRSEANELFAAGTYHTPALGVPLGRVATRAPIRLLFGHDSPDLPRGDDWSNSSDHGPFHRAGLPFIYFGVEDHDTYHTPNDTFERITPDFFVGAVATIYDALKELDQFWASR